MLGNDVVDIKQAALDSKWQRKGYLDKIFRPEEKYEILNSSNPTTMVWLFWSMKESVYKIVNRETGLRLFNPKAFLCTTDFQTSVSCGEVFYEGQTFYTRSSVKPNFIHSIALPVKGSFGAIETIWLAYTDTYRSDFNSKSSNYQFRKNECGMPEFLNRKSGEVYPASVSHHGRFLAIVFRSLSH